MKKTKKTAKLALRPEMIRTLSEVVLSDVGAGAVAAVSEIPDNGCTDGSVALGRRV